MVNPPRLSCLKMIRTRKPQRDYSFHKLNGYTAMHAYGQFGHEGCHADAPWDRLEGQIWLGSARSRYRMAACMPTPSLDHVPACHVRPNRPGVDDIITAVSDADAMPAASVRTRGHPASFHTAVYLLRRVANLRLQEVASRSSVSPSRVSQMQRQVEHDTRDTPLRELRRRYKRKN